MASLFSKEPSAVPPPPRYGRERIQQEIEHLKNLPSARTGAQQRMAFAQMLSFTLVCAVLWLYFMDPFLYVFHKRDAVRDYLYLHSYGSDAKAQALAASGILTENEVDFLNHQQGAFQDYYSTPQRAEEAADNTIQFLQGLHDLREGHYDSLNRLGKLRYQLFVRWGLLTPTHWSVLDPTIE